MAQPTLQRVYTRTDPRGHFPHPPGRGDIATNRLALFWRPIIDRTDSPLAPIRLRAIPVVASWLAGNDSERPRSWFSTIGVPGQRRQVLRHAGLRAYDCAAPGNLPEELRPQGWRRLVELIDHFRELDDPTRALVVFHLAQLSYCRLAVDLAATAPPAADADGAHYAYEVARIHARLPGHIPQALETFEELAHNRDDEASVLAACFQGIGHSLRQAAPDSTVLPRAQAFHRRACPAAEAPAAAFHDNLLRSRFFRAAALLHLRQGDRSAMLQDTRAAYRHHHELGPGRDPAEQLVVRENHRYLTELELRAAQSAPVDPARLHRLCERLWTLDPNCVEVRLALGDSHVLLSDWRTAAHRYEQAGELGTGAGAVGWFRAAQCHQRVGDLAAARNAMAHCLELDTTAVEPRAHLAAPAGA